MDDLAKNLIFTTNAIDDNGQPTTIQYQTTDGTILKQKKIEGQNVDQPTFYYTTTNGNATTVNLAHFDIGDNETCCIAQPVGDYSYALVNGIQLNQAGAIGIATLDPQGRLQIVNQNKLIAATISPIQNAISNISFKCDICGLMFSHLALLNHHKRLHAEGANDQQQQQHQQQQQSETIAVGNVQGIVQTQNIITENGPLGPIQIVATESLEPATASVVQQQQQNAVNCNNNGSNKGMKLEQSKCITCGNQIIQAAKRKGPKIVCCDTCIQSKQASQQAAAAVTAGLQQVTPIQIFLSADGEIKFEMSELPNGAASDSSMDSLTAPNILTSQLHPVQIISTIPQAQAQLQQLVAQQSAGSPVEGECVTTGSGQDGHHAVKKRNTQQVTKCQKCNGSGVVFVGAGNSATNKHQTSVKTENPKPFTCNICGGIFSLYSSLWSHRKLHSGEKNYKCSICGSAFAKAVYLKKHARIHTGEKPYTCPTCGMQFSQSPHLKNHERTHSGERPYVCEVCDKGFARHATLWNHRRIHTGEKPYKCDICGSAFSQSAHLKNHAKVHSGEKPFKCDICSAAFADRFVLKRHRGLHQKNGQTTPHQSAQDQQEQQQQQTKNGQVNVVGSSVIHKQELPEIDNEVPHRL